jgi:hypothetical protein
MEIWGGVPLRATYWSIWRVGLGGEFSILPWGAAGETVELREWPLSDLSVATITARWGGGTYKVQWLEVSPRGARKSICYGRVFTLRNVAVEPPIVRAEPAGIDDFEKMNRLDQRTFGMMDAIFKAAAALGGGQQRGISGEELRSILREEREAATREREREREAHAAQLAAVAARVDELEQEDEDEDPSIVDGAIAAVPRIKGNGVMASILNFAQSNPELSKALVVGGLPIVAAAAMKIASLFEKPPPEKKPEPAPVVEPPAEKPRPRAERQQAAEAEVEGEPIKRPKKNGSPWAPHPTQPTEAAPAAEPAPPLA